MSSFASSLARSLPRPQNDDADDGPSARVRQKGFRVVDGSSAEAGALVRRDADGHDDRGLSGGPSTTQQLAKRDEAGPAAAAAAKPKGNALAIQRGSDGRIDYGVIARQGHSDSRIIQASFKDLIPLRHRANAGDVSLEKPSEEQVAETKERTANALAKIVTGTLAAQRPKLIQGTSRPAPTYVRYTPADQMGDGVKQERLIKIVNRQIDPLAPPKFKHKKIPRGPPSPPVAQLRSPPRKLTAADQAAWRIPPPISNWKNPKGYTVPLDKRLAADGRGLQDVTISEKFAHFQEALFMADRHAREEVRERAMMQQKLAEKERLEKEESLRKLAQKAREERLAERPRGRARSRSYSSRGSSGSSDRSSSRSVSSDRYDSDSEEEAVREREEARRERRRDNQRELRQKRMGAERRAKAIAHEAGRDISEKVALGLAKPTNADAMYDPRLFNRDGGFAAGYNEDQPYDKSLFSAQEAIRSIYRPSVNADADEEADAMDGIEKASRFDVLGKTKHGFKGADEGGQREGPVQFEKDDDPFNIGQMIEDVQRDVQQAGGTKRYGLGGGDSDGDGGRSSKKARVASSDGDGSD